MKKIKLIATGGTIACTPTVSGLVPTLTAEQLLDYIGALPDDVSVDCIDLFSMDSSNIQPEEWCMLARKIHKTSWDYDGIVVTHGTDTMAYTASMLTFMLRGIGVPVILTGSQYPIVNPDSDGRRNLREAIIAASSMEGGVCICFGGAVIKGCRAVKTRTTSLNAFESINYPYIGTFANGCYIPLYNSKEKCTLSFCDVIDPRVALIKLIPGTSTELLEMLAKCDIRGLVVEAFGLGGVHNIRRDHADSIARLIRGGMTVVLASQCLYEASTPDIYEVSKVLRDAGVISAKDMTTESAVTKLMWALGQSESEAEIRKLMASDICGEITL